MGQGAQAISMELKTTNTYLTGHSPPPLPSRIMIF